MSDLQNLISEATRRDIFDSITLSRVAWSGRLEEPDFLTRIFKLKEMPSNDGRFSNAYGDIWQHRVNNFDLPDDWIFFDTRFNLLHCSDDVFLKFLTETIHPNIRSDANEAAVLCDEYNSHLKLDGFMLIQSEQLAGRPVYSWRKCNTCENIALSVAKAQLTAVDDSYISQQLRRMEDSIDSDPDLAIGTSKELVETICKTILNKRSIEYSPNEPVTKLVRLASESLSLVPEGISDNAKAANSIKGILKSLTSIAQGMMDVRNAYGTGHGKSAGYKGLTARHAKLAVGAASTLATFLWDTHKLRE